MTSRLDRVADVGDHVPDDVVRGMDTRRSFGVEHALECHRRSGVGRLHEVRFCLTVTEPALDVVADADRLGGRRVLSERLSENDAAPVGVDVDRPPAVGWPCQVGVVDVAVVDAVEQLGLHGARLVGVPARGFGRRDVHGRQPTLGGEPEDAVEQDPVPSPEPVFDPGLELASPRDPLHEIGVVHRGEEVIAAHQHARRGDLAREPVLLAVPQDLVVDEQLGGDPIGRGRPREHDDLPELRALGVQAGACRELVRVGNRLPQVEGAVGEPVAGGSRPRPTRPSVRG